MILFYLHNLSRGRDCILVFYGFFSRVLLKSRHLSLSSNSLQSYQTAYIALDRRVITVFFIMLRFQCSILNLNMQYNICGFICVYQIILLKRIFLNSAFKIFHQISGRYYFMHTLGASLNVLYLRL